MSWFDLFVKRAPLSAAERARQIAAEQRAAEEAKRRRFELASKAGAANPGAPGSNPDKAIIRRPIGVRSGGKEWGMCWTYRQDICMYPEENRGSHYIMTCYTADGSGSAFIERTTDGYYQFFDYYYILPVKGEEFLLLLVERLSLTKDDAASGTIADTCFYVTESTVTLLRVPEALRSAVLTLWDTGVNGYQEIGWESAEGQAGLFQSSCEVGAPSIYELLATPTIDATDGLTITDFGGSRYYRASNANTSVFAAPPEGDRYQSNQANDEDQWVRYLRIPFEQARDENGLTRSLQVEISGDNASWGLSGTSFQVSTARDPEDDAVIMGDFDLYDGSLAWGGRIQTGTATWWACPSPFQQFGWPNDQTNVQQGWYDLLEDPLRHVLRATPYCVYGGGGYPAQFGPPVQRSGPIIRQFSFGWFRPILSTAWGQDWSATLAGYGMTL